MRVIDLLNKIANKEELPKHILFDNIDYFLEEKREIQCFIEECIGTGTLNDEIKIIEEPKKIEKIFTYKEIESDEYFANIMKVSKNGEYEITEDVSVVIDKINEIIDYINKQ